MAIIVGADVGALVTMLVVTIIMPTISSIGGGGAIGGSPGAVGALPLGSDRFGRNYNFSVFESRESYKTLDI